MGVTPPAYSEPLAISSVKMARLVAKLIHSSEELVSLSDQMCVLFGSVTMLMRIFLDMDDFYAE